MRSSVQRHLSITSGASLASPASNPRKDDLHEENNAVNQQQETAEPIYEAEGDGSSDGWNSGNDFTNVPNIEVNGNKVTESSTTDRTDQVD